MERAATCSCGELTIRVEGDPEFVVACNCSKCQRRTGSVFGVSAYYAKEKILSITGESSKYEQTNDKGRTVIRHFCKHCGTTLYWYSQILPEKIGIAVGCFADPEFPSPKHAVWAESKHDWVEFPKDCVILEQQKLER